MQGLPGFDDALALRVDAASGSATAVIPETWNQGRATFGGLVLGLALRAARARLPEPRPARGLVAIFPAPLGPGEVELRVRELRHGRAASLVQAEVARGADTGCVLLATFGGTRPSSVEVAPPPRPAAPPPETLPPLVEETKARQAPTFTRHFDFRLTAGGPPYSGTDTREIGGWLRFHAPPAALGEEHVVALLDAWPSPAMVRMAQPAPAATLTWSLELLPIEAEPDPRGWWLYHAELEASTGGYAHAAARLWSPAGRLAALSRQCVAVFG